MKLGEGGGQGERRRKGRELLKRHTSPFGKCSSIIDGHPCNWLFVPPLWITPIVPILFSFYKREEKKKGEDSKERALNTSKKL